VARGFITQEIIAVIIMIDLAKKKLAVIGALWTVSGLLVIDHLSVPGISILVSFAISSVGAFALLTFNKGDSRVGGTIVSALAIGVGFSFAGLLDLFLLPALSGTYITGVATALLVYGVVGAFIAVVLGHRDHRAINQNLRPDVIYIA
jgi:hypothetical protein